MLVKRLFIFLLFVFVIDFLVGMFASFKEEVGIIYVCIIFSFLNTRRDCFHVWILWYGSLLVCFLDIFCFSFLSKNQ